MILVDTSVWIDHLRRGNRALERALLDDEVATHPFVVGELACGTMRHREEKLQLLSALPHTTVAADNDVLTLIERRQLMGRGLGFTDCHMLASALIDGIPLWTLDRALERSARALLVV